jgi:hypothetical protein
MPHPAESGTVPTLAELALLGIRAEALRGVPDEIKDANLAAAFDWFLARLGKRVTRPVAELADSEARRVICLRASIQCLEWARGMNPRAGQDALIESAEKSIQAYIDQIKTGDIEILFTDATPAVDEQGPIGGGDVTADAWTKTGCCRVWP